VSRRTVFAIVALAFFFAPLGLRAAGVTARPFENRPMAEFPSVSQGWDAFDQATRFFVDRLPLREQAVRANTWVFTNVYDSEPRYGQPGEEVALPFAEGAEEEAAAEPAPNEPAPQVAETAVKGREGWLFLGGELTRKCMEFLPWATAIERWERFVSILRRGGKRVVMVIAPDKTTIYPEFLPQKHPVQDCLKAYNKKVWDRIEATREPSLVGLRRALLELKPLERERQLYMRKDSHWNAVGATEVVRVALDELGGSVQVQPGDITGKGLGEYVGDLTQLLGASETDITGTQAIVRPGLAKLKETTEPLPTGHPQRVFTRPKGGPPVLPGRTLFVYDSYGNGVLPLLQSYVRELAATQWFDTPPDDLIEAFRRSDTLILELVEREMNFKASDQGLLTADFLRRLEAAFPPSR
jgi:alginate O-acetyltransferase complex protein AlgJ